MFRGRQTLRFSSWSANEKKVQARDMRGGLALPLSIFSSLWSPWLLACKESREKLRKVKRRKERLSHEGTEKDEREESKWEFWWKRKRESKVSRRAREKNHQAPEWERTEKIRARWLELEIWKERKAESWGEMETDATAWSNMGGGWSDKFPQH